jgi:FkbM family methyltransferase
MATPRDESSYVTTPEAVRVAPPYVLLQTRHGAMLCNPGDRYIGRSLAAYGEFSEREIATLLMFLKPGNIVVEAGASIGVLTVPIARHIAPAGMILAFEPQRLIFQILCANLALNGIRNAIAVWAALGDQPGTVKVPVLEPDAPQNFGGLDIRGHDKGDGVDVKTIDGLRLVRCDMIKADVQGMERAVLVGARDTITRCRPLLYLENDRADCSAALIDEVFELGYSAWWHFPPLFNPANFAGRPDDLWLAEEGKTIVSLNMLCVPPERRMRVSGLRAVERGENPDVAVKRA